MRSSVPCGVLIAGVLAGLSACQDGRVAPAAGRAAVECRGFSARGDEVFDASLETLFDSGYSVCLCDRRTGIIGAAGVISPPGLFERQVPRNYLDRLAHPAPDLTVFVDRAKRELRLTTAHEGFPSVDVPRINAFYEALGKKTALSPATRTSGVASP